MNPNNNCPAGFWTVKAGDTLWEIARTNRTTVDALLKLNPGIDPSRLQIGQRICLPEGPIPTGPTPPCESGLFWTVAPGETFYTIARETGVPLDTLLRLNPAVDPLNIPVGTNLCLPTKLL